VDTRATVHTEDMLPEDLMQTTMEDSNPTGEATATNLSMETAIKGLHTTVTNRSKHIVATTNDLLPMVATLLATTNSQLTPPRLLTSKATQTIASPRSLLAIKSQLMDVNPTALLARSHRMAATVLHSR